MATLYGLATSLNCLAIYYLWADVQNGKYSGGKIKYDESYHHILINNYLYGENCIPYPHQQ